MAKNNTPSWQENDNKLTLVLTLENFAACVVLVAKIAKLAESHNHHPDLHITNYKKLTIEIYTHTENKITQKDYELAHAIDQLLAEMGY